MEPIFSYLAQDYRNHPTAAKARALYQNFCAAGAPARLRGCKALPPHNLRIERMMAPLLAAEEPPLPDPRLFDFIVADLARPDDDGPLTTLARTFDPARSAYENLPDGKMTAGQRSFVEKVWRPLVRPALVEVGFWRIGSIGG